jgi:hypothetical protein
MTEIERIIWDSEWQRRIKHKKGFCNIPDHPDVERVESIAKAIEQYVSDKCNEVRIYHSKINDEDVIKARIEELGKFGFLVHPDNIRFHIVDGRIAELKKGLRK